MKQKILFTCILLTVILTTVLLVFILINKNTNNSLKLDITSYPVSFVSYPDSSIINQYISGSYQFNNINAFKIIHTQNFDGNMCSTTTSYPLEPVDIDYLRYEISKDDILNKNYKIGSIHNFVFHNMANYSVKPTLEAINNLLEGKISLSNIPQFSTFEVAFSLSCEGPDNYPALYIKQVPYPRIDKAFIVLYYGSHQSTSSKDYLPIYALIFSKSGNDYSNIQILELTLDRILKVNDLGKCEILSQYGYKYIDVFNNSGKKCVEEVFKQDFDEFKLDTIIQRVLDIYSLKN